MTSTFGSLEIQKLKDSVLLFLPLCPSTNARMGVVRMGGACRQILTSDARNYIDRIGRELEILRKLMHVRPIDSFTHVDMWFILPRTNCDAHNYGKVLFDAFERGGIVTNDKFILPRYQGVGYASDSKAIVKLPWEKLEK